jgi:8-oxo-dGTP pyrophosphatase MutT (NUDIX family)
MTAQTLHRSAVELLAGWSAPSDVDDIIRHTMLAFLAASPRACLRDNPAGHITASTLVLDEGGCHVLLTLHPRVGKWIQLGGHCEDADTTVREAAAREAREESGIADLTFDPDLLTVHTHAVTCPDGVQTRHLDLRFLAWARPNSFIVRSAESADLRWFPVEELPRDTDRESVVRMIELAHARM